MLKKSLAELLGYDQPLSFREYSLWKAYRHEDLRELERSDYYLMQICQRIESVLGKSKPLEEYRVEFSEGKVELTIEEATVLSRANLGLM